MVAARDVILKLREDFLSGLRIHWVKPPKVYRPLELTGPQLSLNELRTSLQTGRASVVGNPGCFLDTSPTGTGKSTSDINCVRELIETAASPEQQAALIVVPTHEECRELVSAFQTAGIEAVAYPARRIKSQEVNCPQCNGKPNNNRCNSCGGVGTVWLDQNCWNFTEPELAESMGLPMVRTICQGCPHQQQCQREGYLAETFEASASPVVIATHARAMYQGIAELTESRPFLSIHEDCVDLVRPLDEISEADLNQVFEFTDELTNNPRQLDYFGSGDSQKTRERRERWYQFIIHLHQMVKRLITVLRDSDTSRTLDIGETKSSPQGVERFLFQAARHNSVAFQNSPWRFLLSAAIGAYDAVGVQVTHNMTKGGEVRTHKAVAGVRRNCPPPQPTAIFSDATTDQETLQSLLGCQVVDITPAGRLELQHAAIQYAQDINRKTADKTVQNLIRGLLMTHTDCNRAGIICHRTHVPAIESLEESFTKRIAKIGYFGSGQERGSNDWYQRCDFLIVIGTPRLPPGAIQSRLLQLGKFDALSRTPEWGTLKWAGKTNSGTQVIIDGKGYADDDWNHAHRSLVRAAIVQAVGRGRGFLADGIPVAVLTSEECGLRLHDNVSAPTFNQSCHQVFTALAELTAENPNKYILEFSAANSGITTNQISQQTGLARRTTRETLNHLRENFGLVRKVGDRSGWLPVLGSRHASGSGGTSQASERGPPRPCSTRHPQSTPGQRLPPLPTHVTDRQFTIYQTRGPYDYRQNHTTSRNRTPHPRNACEIFTERNRNPDCCFPEMVPRSQSICCPHLSTPDLRRTAFRTTHRRLFRSDGQTVVAGGHCLGKRD